MALWLLLGAPVFALVLAMAVRPYRRIVGWSGVAAAAVSLTAAAWMALSPAGEDAGGGGSAGLWRVDALSALLAVCIGLVGVLAAASAPGLRRAEAHDAAQTRRFHVYLNAFFFTMLAAVTVQNVALMWVAIEATTITSAMAIPLHRTKASVEASWKYILVCSVGIALAFAGTVLGYFDSVASAGQVPDALNWTVLRHAAPSLRPELLRLAFAFLVVGYGTKAGLAPMHTWLPDAHSEAPSPISAMMSGVLLAVAIYAIARWKAVVDAALGPTFTNNLLIGFGLLSVAIGTFSLVIQRHYKRMLAYSSVEHIGLVSVALGLGPLGMFAAWLHIVNHAIAKSTTFLLAGRILQRYQTSDIGRVRGLLRAMPLTGALFAAGILALVGLPPFGLFVSEFLLVRAAVDGHRLWLAALVLLLLLTAFVSLLTHLNRMLYGDTPDHVEVGEAPGWPAAALALPMGLLVVLGVLLPSPVSALIDRCVTTLMPR